ncbi:MAG: hypothetical protein ACRDYD_13770 [Acidimicrobiales bacterium]
MAFRYLELVNEITAPMPPMPIARLGPPPLRPLTVPLAQARVLVVSSAGVHYRSDPPFAPVNDMRFRRLAHSAEPGELRPSHPSPIRRPGLVDINVVHPYQRLDDLAGAGVIAGPTSHHQSVLGAIKLLVPLVKELGPSMAADARDAGADVVLLVPLCPACHQAIGILARVIEAEGLATVTLSSCRDITESVRPPRAAFLDFPLGNSAGRPKHPEEQRRILTDALRLAEEATSPGEIVDLAYTWPERGWVDAMVQQYRAEAATVASQRSHELAPDGRNIAAEEVAAVEALLGGAGNAPPGQGRRRRPAGGTGPVPGVARRQSDAEDGT